MIIRDQPIREAWNRFFELPVKVHAVRGRFVFRRGASVYAAKSLDEAMTTICEVLEKDRILPFSAFVKHVVGVNAC